MTASLFYTILYRIKSTVMYCMSLCPAILQCSLCCHILPDCATTQFAALVLLKTLACQTALHCTVLYCTSILVKYIRSPHPIAQGKQSHLQWDRNPKNESCNPMRGSRDTCQGCLRGRTARALLVFSCRVAEAASAPITKLPKALANKSPK